MRDEPWQADRPLTAESAAAAIWTRFPHVDCGRLTHLGSGWEFDAYLTRDDWVFRFPRRAGYAALFGPERHVHRLVAQHLPSGVAVPRVGLVGEPTAGFPYVFAGHRFIPGVGADAVEFRLLPVLAADVGAALGSIHAIPEDAARAAGVREVDPDEPGRREWLDGRLRAAAGLRGLDTGVDEALQWAGSSVPDPGFEGPTRLIHDDLSPEHLLVDPTTGRLTGILDWTDVALGDPARDFVTLVTSGGWDFAERALVSYPGEVDDGFRRRLSYMARLLSVLWLAEAHERNGDVAKHLVWVRNAFSGEVRWAGGHLRGDLP
jgi:macrolide phosphotransferase